MFSIIGEQLNQKSRLMFFAFAFFVAWAFDFFFSNVKVLGFGFFLFVSIYLIGFTILSIVKKQVRQVHALWLLLPIFVFSFDVLIYNNDFVRNFVPLFVAILLFAYSFLLTLRNPDKVKFDLTRLKLLSYIPKGIDKLHAVFADFNFGEKNKNSELYKKILIGVLISVPILFVFLNLFINADPVFADKVHNLFDFRIKPTTVFRIFRTIILTFLVSTFFYVLIDKVHKLEKTDKKALKIDKTIATVVLSLVNFLFASFVVIQLQYLFGSTDFVLERGLVFADYARQGFFQLTWVILLTAIILIFFYRSASEHGSHVILKLLKIFLILQVGVIAMSALKRMNIYQDAYGFTTLRLYVEWFIYFCVVVLGFTAISLATEMKFRKFFNVVVILGVIALAIVSSINVDRMIAKRNIDRYLNEGKRLDTHYLVSLSTDAFEEVKKLNKKIDEEDVSSESIYSGNFGYNVSNVIISEWKEKNKIMSWKEFNFSVNKLYKTNN